MSFSDAVTDTESLAAGCSVKVAVAVLVSGASLTDPDTELKPSLDTTTVNTPGGSRLIAKFPSASVSASRGGSSGALSWIFAPGKGEPSGDVTRPFRLQ